MPERYDIYFLGDDTEGSGLDFCRMITKLETKGYGPIVSHDILVIRPGKCGGYVEVGSVLSYRLLEEFEELRNFKLKRQK